MYSMRRVELRCEPVNQGATGVGKRETCGLCVPRTGYESTKKAEGNSTQRETSPGKFLVVVVWFELNYFLGITAPGSGSALSWPLACW